MPSNHPAHQHPDFEQPPTSVMIDKVGIAAEDELHNPYVPHTENPRELTVSGIILGILLGLVFAASSVYLALKIGLTVSASIPIAVLSITIFRYAARVFRAKPATILQNNIVQTTGSAGESIAAGTVFTLPALLLLGYALPWSRVAAVATVGGLLGVLLMIPLRKSLIVKEHRNLKYPEGTACAEVLIVGEERGVQAKTVFMGFGLGALYKFFNAGLKLWQEVPARIIQRALPNGGTELFGEIRAEISPELTGVGYIIGPKISGYLFAGGVLSFFVLIPAIKLFGSGLTTTVLPLDTKLIRDMSPMEIRASYVYFIGAGAVTAAGIFSLVRSMPTIWRALVGGLGGMRGAGGSDATETRRTQRDLPFIYVGVGVLAAIVAMVVLPQIGINIVGAVLAVFFAFLFVTVSSRITGQIGASANPISGMTVAAVLMTALIFLALGWTLPQHRVLALSIGGVVCVAAAVAGATSQDLKTGYLVGATPARQQVGLLFGVVSSALLIGWTIHSLDSAYTTIVKRDTANVVIPAANIDAERVSLADGRIVPAGAEKAGNFYRVGHLYEQQGALGSGRYLVDDAGRVQYLIDPGIGGRETVDYTGRKVEKLDSPKSQIMSLVVDGILTQKLNWGLIMIGVFFAVAMEILGLPSLAICVGVYLPISTSATMFAGGIVRWLVDRATRGRADQTNEDSGPGVLFSSGLIAGGAIMGVLLAALAAKRWDEGLDLSKGVPFLANSGLLAMVVYALAICVPLYLVGRKNLSLERH
ncbi:MAG: oligopeptide transporter, OPT family [Gemmatimonadaceae bacterium]|nr:oligopeptide transporter, OPT family [Gemmatimonadaceae bacterium]NUR18170.1 oligopeptide transporter, OPT family [Gemmatimonadaceae bacterium]NUS96932.1 oligopeptide transporter, OPT family [Gemmatimonadaceae bacterium]